MVHSFCGAVFDSITNLMIYQRGGAVEHFIQTLVDILSERNCKGVFFALKKSKAFINSPMIGMSHIDDFEQDVDSLLDEENIFGSRMSEGMAVIDINE